ncbi:hypothetical protein C5167_022334 [Papaver somniferum]|uniref:ABC transmembrane type-1 domain-containing protein n=1 Tax=Papaver somniferum TaxID=3469 RepID=A0A4Y7JLE1_PAPSO|nr:hypothetical protein C5167_022334 [Papaver somniferum]
MNTVLADQLVTHLTQKKRDDRQEPEHTDGKEEEVIGTVPFFKLFRFADFKDKVLMAVGTVGACANGATTPIMTILLGKMINSFGNTEGTDQVVKQVSKVALQFTYLAALGLVASSLQVGCWMVTGERQAARIRSIYLKTILRQDIAFFDNETTTGEVIGRMSGDTVLIQEAMGEKVGKFVEQLATFVGGFIVAFVKGWLLTLVMLTTIPPLVITGAAMSIVIAKMASRGQTAYSQAGIVVEQTLGAIRTVAAFTGEKLAIAKYNKSLETAYKAGVQQGLFSGLGFGSITFISFCSYALAIWCGSKLIIDKGYTGGDIINVIVAVLTGSMALGQAAPFLRAFAAGKAAAYKMFEAINRKPEIDAYDTSKGRTLDDIHGDIELKDVCFTYPARPDEQIFNGFCLRIPSGTTNAIVGQSGSGNQEPVLFTSSIKDNIAYGKDGATLEEIKVASGLANAAKFIDKLPAGLDTMVGENGTQLSGGKKQRIAIARAILKNPRILLLDEATSALDAESERIVQEALDRVMINRTTVIVAHRLSTIRNADMIAVIQTGKIIEKGSHTELLEDPEGAYSQLIRLQEANGESANGNEKSELGGQLSRNPSRQSEFSRQLSRNASRQSEFSRQLSRNPSRRTSLGKLLSRASSTSGNSGHHSFSIEFGFPSRRNFGEVASGYNNDDNVPPTKQYKDVPISRLASLNKPEIPVLLLGIVVAGLNGVIFPAFALMLSSVIKTFFEPPAQLKKDSSFWALVCIALGAASLILSPAKTYLFAVAGCKLINRIRSLCFEKAVHMDIDWFDEPEHSSGAIGARLSADAASVRSLVGDSLAMLVESIAIVIAGLGIAFQANWMLSLIILVLIPLIGLNGWAQMKFLKGFSSDAKKKYEEASQVANDAVGSIRTVASFGAEEKVMKLYESKCEGPEKAGVRKGIVSGIGFGITNFLMFSVYALSFYIGGRLVQAGQATFAQVFRVFFALIFTAVGVSGSSSTVADTGKAKISAASVFAILDHETNVDLSNNSGTTLEDVRGKIEFRHVSFKYPTRPDVQIFRDFCLSIHSGKTVALVGESGSGKSTVISLLQRFYNPDSGHITLDGVEI